MATVVIIEDEVVLRRQISRALESAGHEVHSAGSGAEGVAEASRSDPDLVLLDLRLPDGSGLDFLEQIHELDPQLPVVLMTAYGSVKDAVEAMRRGAVDYLQKPLDLDELSLSIEQVLGRQRRQRELDYLRDRERRLPEGVVGADPRLVSIFAQAERLRAADLPPAKRPAILLTGETGTGKGVTARAMHEILGGGPFIEVNCTAMPASLVEAELFGHERGSFTDARAARSGLFEAADGGTIFLDEIGDLDAGMQAKFLKAIEEKRIRRLGSTRDRPVNVHVIAASNRDLDEAVRSGSFRPDLLHRLRVLCFEIPPLRERPEDIRLLARSFCAQLGLQYGGSPRTLSPEAEQVLLTYLWPGNVRELRNVIERTLLLYPDQELGPECLTGLLSSHRPTAPAETAAGFDLPARGVSLEEVERDLMRQALERAQGNRTRAAALLGLTRDTLRYRLEKYGLG